METEYSVGTTNRFSFFLDGEDDPGDEIIPSSQPDKSDKNSKKKVDAKTKGKAKEVKEKTQQQAGKKTGGEAPAKQTERSGSNRDRPPRQGRGSDKEGREGGRRPAGESRGERGDREDRPYRGGEGGGRGGRQRLPSREKDKENEGGFNPTDRGSSRGERGGFRGRPRGGGGRGGFRGKREFERRSGSDKSSVKPVEKRDGGGAHNWGKAEDLEGTDEWPSDEVEPPTQEQDTTPNGEVQVEELKSGEADQEKSEEDKEADQGPQEMTLDEYRKRFAQKLEVVKPESHVRRPGENEDTSQWKNTVILAKTDEEFFPGTREIIEKPKTSGRVKTTLEPRFFFREPARRGGRGRMPGERGGGGRGRDRERERGEGEGGRGGNRGGRGWQGERRGGGGGGRYGREKKERAPNMEDEGDFPSLSTP